MSTIWQVAFSLVLYIFSSSTFGYISDTHAAMFGGQCVSPDADGESCKTAYDNYWEAVHLLRRMESIGDDGSRKAVRLLKTVGKKGEGSPLANILLTALYHQYFELNLPYIKKTKFDISDTKRRQKWNSIVSVYGKDGYYDTVPMGLPERTHNNDPSACMLVGLAFANKLLFAEDENPKLLDWIRSDSLEVHLYEAAKWYHRCFWKGKAIESPLKSFKNFYLTNKNGYSYAGVLLNKFFTLYPEYKYFSELDSIDKLTNCDGSF